MTIPGDFLELSAEVGLSLAVPQLGPMIVVEAWGGFLGKSGNSWMGSSFFMLVQQLVSQGSIGWSISWKFLWMIMMISGSYDLGTPPYE